MTSRDFTECIERYDVDVETMRDYRDYRNCMACRDLT